MAKTKRVAKTTAETMVKTKAETTAETTAEPMAEPMAFIAIIVAGAEAELASIAYVERLEIIKDSVRRFDNLVTYQGPELGPIGQIIAGQGGWLALASG